MTSPLVTILIPHYQTLELTKLCLRLLRKHTDCKKAHVIVIDNGSKDASTDYLRTLSWIELIERTPVRGEKPVQAHSRALDIALDRVTTPYVLSIHTDTLVKDPRWLDFLLASFQDNPRVAGVGSWKLESKSWWRDGLKQIERQIQRFYYLLTGNKNHGLEGIGHNYLYLRSHCAMYRTDLLKQLNLYFSDGDQVAGKAMHRALVEAGYEMIFLPSFQLNRYIEHINHATTVLNPGLSSRQKSITKGMRRIEKTLMSMNAKVILEDASLDR